MTAFDRILFFRVYHQLFNESLSAIRGEEKGKKTRSFLKFIFFTCLINIALCVNLGYLAYLGVAASDFLLNLFMINMGIYFVYYVWMKIKKNERPTGKTWAYLGSQVFALINFSLFQYCSAQSHLCDACCVLLHL